MTERGTMPTSLPPEKNWDEGLTDEERELLDQLIERNREAFERLAKL